MQPNHPSYFPPVVQNYGVPQPQQVITTYSNPQAQVHHGQLGSSPQVVTPYSYPKLTSIQQISQEILFPPIVNSFSTHPSTTNFPSVVQVPPNAMPPSSTAHVTIVTQHGKPIATISLSPKKETIANLNQLPLYQANVNRHYKN